MTIRATLKGDFGQTEFIELEITTTQYAGIFSRALLPGYYRTGVREGAWDAIVRGNWPRIVPLLLGYTYPSQALWHGGFRIAGLFVTAEGTGKEEYFTYSVTRQGFPEFLHDVFDRTSAINNSKK